MNLIHIYTNGDRSITLDVGDSSIKFAFTVRLLSWRRNRWDRIVFLPNHGHHHVSQHTPLVNVELEWWDREAKVQ